MAAPGNAELQLGSVSDSLAPAPGPPLSPSQPSAGYGIRALLVTQNLAQHQGVYGKQESITANCHVRIAFEQARDRRARLADGR